MHRIGMYSLVMLGIGNQRVTHCATSLPVGAHAPSVLRLRLRLRLRIFISVYTTDRHVKFFEKNNQPQHRDGK